MKTLHIGAILTALLVSSCGSFGQGFINLDFEDATIVPVPLRQSRVYADQALAGWTAYTGDGQLSTIFYNTIPIGSTDVSILDPTGGPSSLDGVYSVYLSGGIGGQATQATIRQTGLVPIDVHSISFIAKYYGTGVLSITLGGESISFAALSLGSTYTEYGGSIPAALAGQIAELTFTVPTRNEVNNWEIDNIQFSPISIPEPTFTSLVAAAAICLWASGKWFNHPNSANPR